MSPYVPENEAELDAFRRRWREEVSARNKRPDDRVNWSRRESKAHQRQPLAGPSTAPQRSQQDYSEDIAPKSYHDLPDKEEHLKLANAGQNHDRHLLKEPSSALEHYERAVEKEDQGQLGDSMKHYRKAFKLDDRVHEAYKKKHFPPSSFVKPNPTNPNPSNAPVTVRNTAHHSLHGGESTLAPSVKQLLDGFAGLRIEAPPPPSDVSPAERSLLGELPEEILTHILQDVASLDVASFARLAQVCKRLAYLVMTEESIWKPVALGDRFGFAAMRYSFACDIKGSPLVSKDKLSHYPQLDDVDYESDTASESARGDRSLSPSAVTEQLLRSTYADSWRQMFRSRPRIRFNGCYISTVNYTRSGLSSTNTLSWGAPVHVVTYFRYLRFFRDGTVISLLTTAEPIDVVHHLIKENLHDHHGNVLPNAVMRDALRGRWRLAGRLSGAMDPVSGQPETEGDVHVETEGATSKYTYKMQLALSHAGKGARNNKLAWKGFWSHNLLTDDLAEFWLRNDKAYYWSRVKSFGQG